MNQPPLLPTKHLTLTSADDPLELLCRRLNVVKPTFKPGASIPPTINLRVVKDAHVPSHVLAVFDTPESSWGPSYQPILVPIRADLYTQDFRTNIVPPSPPGTPFPVPHCVPLLDGQFVTLPVVPTLVPHAASIPLLILFAFGLESRSHLLSCRLLPSEVIGEFPDAMVMAQSMAELCSDAQLTKYITFNQGLWRNILALGPRDTQLIGMAQTAWNVTVEARRIRLRATMNQSMDAGRDAPNHT
ncbi:hypothetical protein F5I97DRAFT_1815528 [Phlebopus sp. FC_14]|nr:hypothetical protein F5I97DRAFT_1815528 [Phlebopus sp. FC_14]